MSNSPDLPGLESILGKSPAIMKLKAALYRVATAPLNVILKGEKGTGKSHVARVVHTLSGRDPFVSVNLAVIQPAIASAELFGFVKGAFTGAIGAKTGLIASADGGTLF